MPEGALTSVPAIEPLSAWPTEALTDDSREAFFQAVLARQANTERDAGKVRQLGLICGAAGLLVGTLGVLAALTVYIKTPVPPPPGYILVDRETGTIDRAVAAVDAPRLFPETVRERALRDFVTACEAYVPETFARLDYHACMVMATPAEQKRRAEDIGPRGTRYPPTLFGPGGWAMPTAFYAFTQLGTTGTEPNQTFHYQVRYERTEVINGKEARPRYTARIDFSFHPELRISAQDRIVNPSGLQVIAYSTTMD
jgi:type IV secretory pathway component VirB8